MSITAEQSATEQIVVKAREPAPPRRFLAEPTDIVAIATLAQEHTRQATIPYMYAGERRELRIFAGGWWDASAAQPIEEAQAT